MTEELLSLPILIGLFIILSFIVTYVLKKYFNAQAILPIVSMVRTTKPLWVFDALAKHKRFFHALCDVGLVLGFGIIAVDFLYTSKLKKTTRILALFISFLVLAGFFYTLDLILGNSFSNSFITKPFFIPIVILFGLTGFCGFIFALLVLNAHEIIYRYLIGEKGCPGIAPLIPGVEVPNVPITAPLWVWIPLFLILIIHETAHGVLGRIAKVKIKSTGVLLLGFLPIGAFVEPDDKDVEKKSELEKVRFFVAGVASNLASFALAMGALIVLGLVITFFFGAWSQEIKMNSVDGVRITGVQEQIMFCGSTFESPAFGELEEGMKIIKVNNVEINTVSDLLTQLNATRFKPTTFLVEKEGVTSEKTLTSNELGSFGINIEEIQNPNYVIPEDYKLYSSVVGFIAQFLSWLLLLNIGIALVNYLPVPFFDGGRIITILLFPYLGFLNKNEKETEKLLHKIFSIIILILFLINFLPVIL